MSRILAAVVFASSTAALALAQDTGDRPRRSVQVQSGGDFQPAGDARRGDGRMGFPAGGRGGQFMERMFQRTAEDLDLDETQKAEFDRLAQPQLDRMKQMNERWAEVREAQDAGDEARARQIREQLQRNMNPTESLGQVLDELEPTLRPEQIEKAENIRERMQSDTDSRDRMRRIATELPEALQLDETQKQQMEELLTKSREEMGNRMRAMGPLFDQMREAREAGDTSRLRELEKQMEAQRPDAAAMNARYEEFFKQVEGILRDDQKPLLANFKDEVGLGEANAADAKAGSTDVRGILQMAKRLKLNPSQKDELKDIEKDAMKAWKQAGRDKEARADLAQQVHDEIGKMLDQTQRDRFEELLQRADKRSSTKR